MSLPRRHCVVKVESNPAFRTRTADLSPAYKSSYFKSLMLPLFRKSMLAKSRYLRAIDIIDKEIADRAAAILRRPAPQAHDFPPAPMPFIDDPLGFADSFLKSKNLPPLGEPPPAPQPKQKRGKAQQSAGPDLRVIDGGAGVDKPKQE
jgi:hypothetical protein